MAWGAPRGIADLVQRVASKDPTLQSLCLLKGRRFEEADALQLAEALAANSVLRELTIASHAVGPAAAAAFARALAANACLTSLELGNAAFGDEGVAALAPGVAASRSLKVLNLELKGISLAGCAALAPVVAGSSSSSHADHADSSSSSSSSSSKAAGLEELVLGQNEIGAEGLAALLGDLSSSSDSGGSGGGSASGSSLRALDLSSCGLRGAEGVDPLAAALQQGLFPRLQRLRLDGNELGDEGAAALAGGLSGGGKCPLRELSLQRCGLGGGAGQLPLVESLMQDLPGSLESLDLSGNSAFGSPGAYGLATAVATGRLPNLRRLALCGCGLGDFDVATVALALHAEEPEEEDEAVLGGAAAAAAAVQSEAAGQTRPPLSLDLSGNSVGPNALDELAMCSCLAALCLHDCKLGGAAADALAPEAGDAAMAQLVAAAAFRQLGELDLSGNHLQAQQLLALLEGLQGPASGEGGGEGAGAAGLPLPRLRLLVIAANPGAADEQVSAAIERLQEARPELNVVRRAADTGEGGLMR